MFDLDWDTLRAAAPAGSGSRRSGEAPDLDFDAVRRAAERWRSRNRAHGRALARQVALGRLDPDELGEEDEACLVAATTLGERAAMLARFIEAAGKGAPAGRATMNSRLGGRFVGIEGVVELDEPDRKIRIRSSALDP